MFTVYLRESDDTWTPFKHCLSKVEAITWADEKGIDYQVEVQPRGGEAETVAIRKFGKCVTRR
ncbi:hypothetical protein EVC02_073 [Rhizobium phage RHph_N17]|nr:hypothetical protein EVC02_073 [Rhizobium phage RHph_N17]